MNNTEFGKDLGLMHELIVMGRKAGFGRTEWATLAHSDTLMRATLNFIRSTEAPQFPPTSVESEKIVRLAKLMKLVLPYYHTCILCDEAFKSRHKDISQTLLEGYEALGLVLSPSDKREILGGCHQPFRILESHLKSVLGVEFVYKKFTDTLATRDEVCQLSCYTTLATSVPNILALMDAVKNEGFSLHVDIRFERN